MNFRDEAKLNKQKFETLFSNLFFSLSPGELVLETTFQKLVKVENVQQADSSRKGILLRILGPTVFFTRRQTMKDERNAFSFSGIRIPYFPYLVSIPIETLFAHFSSLSPPSPITTTVDVWHFDAVIHPHVHYKEIKRERKKKKE